MENIRIRAIEIYHPENKIGNDYYINHFDKQGKDIRRLLEAFGREERYIVDNAEDNTATMGAKASIKALEKAGLKGEDIDMILFSSSTPQYTVPTQSLIVHNAIGAKKECMVMDTNVNCVGMIVAVDNAVRHLKTNKRFKRALIVGSDYMSVHFKKTDEMTYPLFGDLACAVILEKTEEDSDFYGSKYYAESTECAMVKYPACGSHKLYEIDENDNKKMQWTPFDGSFSVEEARLGMNELTEELEMKISDIDYFCISQFALGMRIGCSQAFNVSLDKIPYVGDKYGYTGTTSPFLALYQGIEDGTIKRGDTVGMWSIGTYWATCCLIFKY